MANESFSAYRPGIFQSPEAWNSYILILLLFHCLTFVFVLFFHVTWSLMFLPLWRSWLWCVWDETGNLAGWGLTLRNWALLWMPKQPSPFPLSFSRESNTPFSPQHAQSAALITRLHPGHWARVPQALDLPTWSCQCHSFCGTFGLLNAILLNHVWFCEKVKLWKDFLCVPCIFRKRFWSQ